MAKTIKKQLDEALAAGDLDKVRILVGKLQAKEPVKAAPKKAKTRKAATAPTAPAPEPPTPRPGLILTGDNVIDYRDLREMRRQAAPARDPRSTFLMPESGSGSGKSLGRQMRRESIAVNRAVVVPLADNGRGGYDGVGKADARKIDEANGRNEEALPYRPKQFQVRIDCEGCRRPFVVYESELTPRFDDEGRGSDWVYRCVHCCRGGR